MQNLLRLITFLAVFTGLIMFIHPLCAQNHQWSFGMGGAALDGSSGSANGTTLAYDNSGFVLVGGNFTGANVNFNPGGTALLSSSGGSADIFLARYNSLGQYQWAFAVGGTGGDHAYSIAVDASGNTYMTGYFNASADFDPGGTSANLAVSGTSSDIFIAKYNCAGGYQWAFRIGGTGFDYGTAVRVDAAGYIAATGYFQGPVADFNPGGGTANLNGETGYDLYVARYDNAAVYQWAFKVGYSGYQEIPIDITTDNSNNIFITGWFSMTVDFDPGGGTANVAATGGTETFVAKYTSAGSFQWAFGIGGIFSDNGRGLVTDASGNLYVSGNFQSSADFDPDPGNAVTLTAATSSDAFMAKYNASGQYQWAFQVPANGTGRAISLDASGNIYWTGSFQGSNRDFDPGAGSAPLSASGTWYDVFLAKYDNAAAYQWAFRMGASAVSDYGYDISTDADCGIYLTGTFQGANTDFDPGSGSAFLSSNGSSDIFLAQYSCTALPLRLLAFEADAAAENMVLLRWQTASENADGLFAVERSADGRQFARLAVLPASGKPSGYDYLDKRSEAGSNYYRLQWSEPYAQTVCSRILEVNLSAGLPSALGNIYYDVPENRLNAELVCRDEADRLKIHILDLSGKEVFAKELDCREGSRKIVLDTGHLQDGSYFVKLTSPGGSQVKKFIVSR